MPLPRPRPSHPPIRMAAALFAALAGTSAAAEPGSPDALATALAQVPQSAFQEAKTGPVRFVDLDVVQRLTGKPPARDNLGRVLLAQGIAPLMSLAMAEGDTWQKDAGIAPDQLAYVAGFGMAPAEFSLWGLRSEADAKTLQAALSERGFTQRSGILANGEDNAMDLKARAPGNPWRGPMGRTAAVAFQGNTVIQGPAAGAVRALRSPRHTAAEGPAIVAVEGAASAGGDIVQALVYGPALGLAPAVDPAILRGKTPAAAREAVAAAMGQNTTGVPPYGAAALADLQGPEGAALAISLAYEDCDTAQSAATIAADLWKTEDAAAQGVTATTHASAEACAAVVHIPAGPGEPNAANPVFQKALAQFYRRNLTATRIGAAP
ncbi:hypothetical protein IMZ29_09530 [Achromobacter sp. GG226]|uniref:hypothetical protein n=1 Tax=Verticiella alkaliphila TaxID=2779529 RepID=UPI001C0C9D27|nr:hypothetical protein [Verticiella sp. GG226]MBU4610761.1 hypothetical protein [Verticiella sp. GG226]